MRRRPPGSTRTYALCPYTPLFRSRADGVEFVAMGERILLFGKIADRVDRGDVAVHRIDAFERDQLRGVGIVGGEKFFQMRKVVVAPNALFAAGIADARDHRRVI